MLGEGRLIESLSGKSRGIVELPIVLLQEDLNLAFQLLRIKRRIQKRIGLNLQRGEGIRCNTIAPGIILTPKTEPTFGGAEKWKRLKAHMLSPRLGKPDDIASAVLWLISDEGTYMNGQCLSIDGGQMSHQNLLIGAVAGI